MNRRTFLKNTTAAAAGLFAGPRPGQAAAPASRVIDTHTHFYDPARPTGVPWPGKGSPLYRRVLPQDWLAVAGPLGVTETVVVEASSWLEDNAWILDLAATERCVVGFVGHLLPHEADFEAQLQRFAANPLFRGIRVSQGDFSRHLHFPQFRKGLTRMADLGLELDINGPPGFLEGISALAADLPDLRIVINHVGGAGDPARLTGSWRNGMKVVGQRKNVYCKISGMIEQTETSGKTWGSAPRDTAYYAPILDHCWECFGEDRLVYGSNWPVCEKGGSYADQFRIVTEYFAAKGAEAAEKYFWKNARTAYRCAERPAR